MKIKWKNFIRNLPHIHIGVKLHLNYFYAKISGKYQKFDICVAFPSIEDGIKACGKIEKKSGIPIPVPDEIIEECGIAILTDKRHLSGILKSISGIPIKGVYRRKEGKFVEKVDIQGLPSTF